jgi:hypothetical protein
MSESESVSCIYECPHCRCYVETRLDQINCKIFRHGVFKAGGAQIDPHLCRAECDRLVANDAIYGCGRPYILHFEGGQWQARACDYI